MSKLFSFLKSASLPAMHISAPTLSLSKKFITLCCGLVIPGVAIHSIAKIKNTNFKSEDYLSLASTYHQKMKEDGVRSLEESKKFLAAPNHKVANFWNELVNLHKSTKGCRLKVKFLGRDYYKSLEEIRDEQEKIQAALSSKSLGIQRINKACMLSGIGSIVYLDQNDKHIWKYRKWDVYAAEPGVTDVKKAKHYDWDYQKSI